MKRFAAVAGVALAAVSALTVTVRAQTPSAEEDLLELINGARRNPLVMHEGLRAAARSHAASMAAAEELSHAGARSRIYGARPEPRERDGAPDDGFTGTWCEVAGWEPVQRDENVARQFFDAWQAKPEDSECMMNGAMTVAGIGMYARGQRWWASLALVEDRSVPERAAVGTATPRRPAAAAARPTPTPTRPARASDSSSAVGDLASEETSSDLFLGLGWKGIAVAAGGFLVAPVLHTLRRRLARR